MNEIWFELMAIVKFAIAISFLMGLVRSMNDWPEDLSSNPFKKGE